MKIRHLLLIISLVLIIPHAAFCVEKVAVLNLKAGYGIDEKLAETLSLSIQDAVYDLGGFDVAGSSDIKTAIEKSKDKNLSLSCEDTLCLRRLGRTAGAKYVMAGSVSRLGQTWSVNLRLIDVKGESAGVIKREARQCRGKIDELFDTVRTAVAAIMETRASEKTEAVMFQPVKRHAVQEKIVAEMRRSIGFRFEIEGFDIGDIDGDGKKEAVFAGSGSLYMCRYHGSNFGNAEKIGVKKIKGRLIDINTADINGNGICEIYVTSTLYTGRSLQSIVLEYNGKEVDKVSEHPGLLFRVINMPGRGRILLGQKKLGDKIFTGNVHEYRWEKGQYVEKSPLELPESVNIFGFALGDVLNKGEIEVVSFSRANHIRVFDKRGDNWWTSSVSFGGNRKQIERNDGNRVDRNSYFCIPQRIHVADMDNNGRHEIIAVKNSGLRLLSKNLDLNSGHIECLAWNGTEAEQKWRSPETGYISDYIVEDINNNGRDELIYSVVEKETGFFSRKTSHLVMAKFSSATQ